PRYDWSSVRIVQDTHHWTAEWFGAFPFEKLGQLFELPAFSESDDATFEWTCHAVVFLLQSRRRQRRVLRIGLHDASDPPVRRPACHRHEEGHLPREVIHLPAAPERADDPPGRVVHFDDPRHLKLVH